MILLWLDPVRLSTELNFHTILEMLKVSRIQSRSHVAGFGTDFARTMTVTSERWV